MVLEPIVVNGNQGSYSWRWVVSSTPNVPGTNTDTDTDTPNVPGTMLATQLGHVTLTAIPTLALPLTLGLTPALALTTNTGTDTDTSH